MHTTPCATGVRKGNNYTQCAGDDDNNIQIQYLSKIHTGKSIKNEDSRQTGLIMYERQN